METEIKETSLSPTAQSPGWLVLSKISAVFSTAGLLCLLFWHYCIDVPNWNDIFIKFQGKRNVVGNITTVNRSAWIEFDKPPGVDVTITLPAYATVKGHDLSQVIHLQSKRPENYLEKEKIEKYQELANLEEGATISLWLKERDFFKTDLDFCSSESDCVSIKEPQDSKVIWSKVIFVALWLISLIALSVEKITKAIRGGAFSPKPLLPESVTPYSPAPETHNWMTSESEVRKKPDWTQ